MVGKSLGAVNYGQVPVFIGGVERILVLFVDLLHVLSSLVLLIIGLLIVGVDTCDKESVTVILNILHIVLLVAALFMLPLGRVLISSGHIGIIIERLEIVDIDGIILGPGLRNVCVIHIN